MDQVAQIREKIDIVALISQFIPLKKLGRNFKANCPFHNEKSPSFVVSPERQIWHCFGCNLGGDAYSFLMQYERIEFPEALRILAEKTGIVLESKNFETGLSGKKEKIYALNRLALEFYHYLLVSHPIGKKALDYLSLRKITPKAIETFKLGYASNQGRTLVNYLIEKKKEKPDDLLEAGLITKRGTTYYDFFQGRLIFPLFDHRDNIIGFSGRILEGNTSTSKYINTRETLVYHKGQVFFGLNNAKNEIKKLNQAIIMEGELDVISSFQEGISNALAVKGTALTTDQVNLLSRFTNKVSLCFDTDSAGQEALKRSILALEKKEMTITVVVNPTGKDPAESIGQNPLAFKKAVKESVDVYEYLLNMALNKFDKTTGEGKSEIGKFLLPLLGHIQNEIVKEHHLTKLSKEIKVSYESLLAEMEKISKKEVVKSEVVIPKIQKPRVEMLEEYLVALLLQAENPKEALEYLNQFIKDYTFSIPGYQKIISHLLTFLIQSSKFNAKDFLETLPLELIPIFDICFLLPIPKFNQETYLSEVQKVTDELYKNWLKKEITQLSDTVRQKEKEGLDEEVEKLQAEISHLISLLHQD